MANLTKTKTLFAFTSPRTIEKIIPEIRLLINNYHGQRWSGNRALQTEFYRSLQDSDFFEGSKVEKKEPDFSARERITRAPKALGFVDLSPKIQITPAGKALLSGKRINDVFTRQLLKFQLPSPYHTQSKEVTFGVRPYLEFLHLLVKVDSLSKTEIALFFTQLIHINKFDEIVKKILVYRKAARENTGNRKAFNKEYFVHELERIYATEIKTKRFKTRESKEETLTKFINTKEQNLKDYADAFIRAMRSSQLISFQKNTYRIIIADHKKKEVNFILENVDPHPKKFSSLEEFKEYLFSTDNIELLYDDENLLKTKIRDMGWELKNKKYSLEELKDLLTQIEQKIINQRINEAKSSLKSYGNIHDVMNIFKRIINRDVPDPALYLEWNTWRAMIMLNYAKDIRGNFSIDLDGLPLRVAGGNVPDIQIDYGDFSVIVEVTTSTGNTQYNMEAESVPRHFGRFNTGRNTYCLFIAPKISVGTLAHFFNLNRMNTKLYGGKTKIIPLNISQFITFIETAQKYRFNKPSKLQEYFESIHHNNQVSPDEENWYKTIGQTLSIWAQ